MVLTERTSAHLAKAIARAKQQGKVLDLNGPLNLVLGMLVNGGIPGIPSVFKARTDMHKPSSKWLDSENLILRAHMRVFGFSAESVKSVRVFLPGRTIRSIETHYRRTAS